MAAHPVDPQPLETSARELARLRASGSDYAILDVRDAWELAICGFDEAIHIPLGALPEREAELPRERMLVAVCHTGRRSLLAVRYLRGRGFAHAVNLRGGIEAWAREVDPTMPRY